jgi:hypothetical protein
MARRGARTPKSSGRGKLRFASLRLLPLRLPSAAAFFRSNLRCLLGGVPGAGRACLQALRRPVDGRRFGLKYLPFVPFSTAGI